MQNLYDEWYEEFKESAELFGEDELYGSLDSLLRSSRNTFAMNRKLMAKAIDVTWVEAIENGLIHVDNVLRNPRLTIEDVEEIVPIALSRKITVESVKHLAQHTDLIQSIDEKTGKITPSKILNVHKEESYFTYENKFVNTLVDRLYIFINTRYEKLAQVARDEEVYSLGYNTTVDDGMGGRMKIELKLETTDSLDTYNDSGYTVWQRVEKLKKAIEGYKGSVLCQTLGNTYIRPPVMRTNAIMKNVDLKACLTLWQYIESYDKVGYEINVEDTAVKPEDTYIDDFYRLVILNLLLFRSYTDKSGKDLTELKTQKLRAAAPKFVKRFGKEISGDYAIQADGVAGYIASDGELKLKKKLPPDMMTMFGEIDKVIATEREYIAKREAERLERIRYEEELERKRQEQRRIEEARLAELERIRAQKEEEERRLQELLEQKRAEQEAEERERARQEAERLARLEEIRKREEEARLRREEEERIAAERARIEENKANVRGELGEAEGMDTEDMPKELSDEELEKQAYDEVTKEEIEQAKAAMEEAAEEAGEDAEPEFEDPRAVAARMRIEQQKKEKERREAERAQRLKAERQYFESKPFEEIRREYSKNPIYAIPRLIRWILAMVFGIIPEDTDNPAFKAKRAEIEEKKRQKEEAKKQQEIMERYYRKYARTFKYRFLRSIDDRKFKKKRRQQMKGKPKPKYIPPQRTPEEQKAIDDRIKALYKEYHVSVPEKIRRRNEERQRAFREWNKQRKLDKEHEAERRANKKAAKAAKAEDRKTADTITADGKTHRVSSDEVEMAKPAGLVSKIVSGVLSVIAVLLLAFVIYVMVCAARGKPVKVFGKSLLMVVTGSMEPSIHTGDFIIVESTDASALKEGDIISFYSEQSDIKGMLVTHRITEVTDDGFITKGDANPVEDSISVPAKNVVGKYTGKARFFIWLYSFASPRKLLMILVIIPISAAAVYEVVTVGRLTRKAAEENRISAEERHEQLMREAIEAEKKRLEEEGYRPEDEPEPDEPEEDVPEPEDSDAAGETKDTEDDSEGESE